MFISRNRFFWYSETYIQIKCASFPPHFVVGSLQKGNYSSQSGMIPGSWQHKMKLQLILKSSKAYYVLSDAAMSLQKYGRALRYIKLALQSHGKSLQMNMFNSIGRRDQRRHLNHSEILLSEILM